MTLDALTARLDYLHLVCGMAWLFLGVLCRFGGWEKNHLLASRWLRWSVFALAIDQWIDGLGAVWTGHLTHEAAAYLASLLPLLGLLEFGRRAAAGSRTRALARWSLLLILAFLAWLACRQYLGFRFLSLSVIAVPTAWVVIRTFTHEARQERMSGRWLNVAGWAAGGYLVCMGLVDPFHPLALTGTAYDG